MRHRPLDVSKWTCAHVAQWLGEQQWAWKELSLYQARLCSVGVDGTVLYQLDDHDLRHDIKVRTTKSQLCVRTVDDVPLNNVITSRVLCVPLANVSTLRHTVLEKSARALSETTKLCRLGSASTASSFERLSRACATSSLMVLRNLAACTNTSTTTRQRPHSTSLACCARRG